MHYCCRKLNVTGIKSQEKPTCCRHVTSAIVVGGDASTLALVLTPRLAVSRPSLSPSLPPSLPLFSFCRNTRNTCLLPRYCQTMFSTDSTAAGILLPSLAEEVRNKTPHFILSCCWIVYPASKGYLFLGYTLCPASTAVSSPACLASLGVAASSR